MDANYIFNLALFLFSFVKYRWLFPALNPSYLIQNYYVNLCQSHFTQTAPRALVL